MRLKNILLSYEFRVAIILLFTPLLLVFFDKGTIRTSISNYAYMEHNQVYYLLIFLAAFMFLYNGKLSIKNYNILLGLTLIGIGLTPHIKHTILHNIFAVSFFLGSVIVMLINNTKNLFTVKVLAATTTVLSMLVHFLFDWYSLFYAEWIGIVPISIHYIENSITSPNYKQYT